ncbi:TraB/GumN family protein [uncultured Vibrio sp.]|uniref:TraB/GumN family protein n=1 Tax=uncultured Vibrio sp. TaxID=114054 RepID=UPI0025D03554|nr:TraB/GumN family protein [uncultured Vibrio sp.]
MALSEPLHWLVTKDNKQLMILGSIHVGNEEMYPLPAGVSEFLASSDGLILEADTRKTQGIQYPSSKYSVKDVLNTAQLNRLTNIERELNVTPSTLSTLPPWTAALAIQVGKLDLLGYKASQGVDHKLLYEAALKERKIVPLETVQFQIDLIANLPNDGEDLLLAAIDEYHQTEEMTSCLVDSWKAGDVDNLNEFAAASEFSEEFSKLFITDRNIDWAEKLDGKEFLPNQSGRYLVVVGTLHLLGKKNLIDELKARGFTVEKLSTSHSVQCRFS